MVPPWDPGITDRLVHWQRSEDPALALAARTTSRRGHRREIALAGSSEGLPLVAAVQVLFVPVVDPVAITVPVEVTVQVTIQVLVTIQVTVPVEITV